MTFSFTLYTNNDFLARGKIVGRKTPIHKPTKTKQQPKRSKPRSKFTKIPRKSVPLEDLQPSIIAETPVLVEIQKLNYDSSILQRYYEQQRLLEWMNSAKQILHKKLQPDFCKFGFFLSLGSCLPSVLHDTLVGQRGMFWEQEHKVLEDGYTKKPIRNYYYFNQFMPDLLDDQWFMRYHGANNPNYVGELRSLFREILFIVEQEDGRIYCHYAFSTQTRVDGGEWFDTS